MPLEPESDLHWKAFLYVSGELSPDEASSFEGLLADDQDARDAVIRAVEMTDAVAIVGRERFLAPRRKWVGRVLVGGVTLAAAAGILLAMLPTFPAPQPPTLDASAVAEAWSGLRERPETDWSVSTNDPQAAESADPASTTEVEEAEFSTDRALPSWLLSAASKPRKDTSQEEN